MRRKIVAGNWKLHGTRSFATAALPAGLSEIELVEVGSRRFVFGAVHGSDGPDTARFEIGYFFAATELCPRG